jgi:carbon storage regulator
MLVLTRKVGEDIIVNGSIRITVTSIKGDKVRIGITAPPDVPIHREEVLQRLCEFAEPDLIATCPQTQFKPPPRPRFEEDVAREGRHHLLAAGH